jgi:hypothetical protein
MGLILVAGFLGSSLAAAALLAIWVAFGRSSWIRRGTYAILGGSAAGLGFCLASGELELEWLGLMWIVVMTITLMFLAARCFGVRLVNTNQDNSNDDRGVYTNDSQFTIRQLMILTAATAAIAAVARLLAPLMMTVEALIFGGGIAICLGFLALIAAWTTLTIKLNRTRFIILAAISLAIAAFVYCVMEVTEADPGLVWGCVVVIYAAALSTALMYARSSGIRLLRDHENRVDANLPDSTYRCRVLDAPRRS